MARLLTRSMLPIKSNKSKTQFLPLFSSKLCRFLSHKAEIIEIDLGSSSSSSFDGDTEAVMMKKMEDLIQRIIVQRSTPDWLPFMPGSSFWVPPGNQTRPGNLEDLFSKLRGTADMHVTMPPPRPFTDEQQIGLMTLRGWPSPHFYDHAESPHDSSSPPQDMEVTLEVTVFEKTSSDEEDN